MKQIKNTMKTLLLIISLLSIFSFGCGETGGYSLLHDDSTTINPLTISTKVPTSGDIEVDLVKPIEITFSDDVQASTVTSSSLTVVSGVTPVSGSWSYNSSTKKATFTPTTSYPSGSQITVTATNQILRLDNLPLTSTQWTFTTVSLADLIAYWRFDGNGSDYSGNNHTATSTNVTYDSSVFKQGSSSAYFNGSAFFDVGTINLGNAFTIAVWVYLPDPITTGINTVISNGVGGIPQNGFKIFINEFGTNNRKVATEAGDGTDGTLLLTSANFVTLGAWKHLAVVIDKAAAPANRALFYFDGALTTQTLGPGSTLSSFPSTFGTNQQTYIGQFPGNTFRFTGRMDDFRIYNRVLSQTEVQRISQQN